MAEPSKLILLVDEDISVRNGLSVILENSGYKVDVAKNGQEALERAKTKQFDAVVVDIRLPDIEGTELLSKLPTQGIIKILITRFSTVESGIKAADCVADDYLVKPVKPEELLKTLRVWLAKL
jgi:DNA-binding response OmpR family regulator